MGDIFIYVGIACVAYWIGWTVRGVVLIFKLSRDPRATLDLLEQLKAINDSDTGEPTAKNANWVEVRVEQVGATVYAYANDTHQFLGQGTSIEEAIQMAKRSHPTKIFWWNETEQDSQTA